MQRLVQDQQNQSVNMSCYQSYDQMIKMICCLVVSAHNKRMHVA